MTNEAPARMSRSAVKVMSEPMATTKVVTDGDTISVHTTVKLAKSPVAVKTLLPGAKSSSVTSNVLTTKPTTFTAPFGKPPIAGKVQISSKPDREAKDPIISNKSDLKSDAGVKDAIKSNKSELKSESGGKDSIKSNKPEPKSESGAKDSIKSNKPEVKSVSDAKDLIKTNKPDMKSTGDIKDSIKSNKSAGDTMREPTKSKKLEAKPLSDSKDSAKSLKSDLKFSTDSKEPGKVIRPELKASHDKVAKVAGVENGDLADRKSKAATAFEQKSSLNKRPTEQKKKSVAAKSEIKQLQDATVKQVGASNLHKKDDVINAVLAAKPSAAGPSKHQKEAVNQSEAKRAKPAEARDVNSKQQSAEGKKTKDHKPRSAETCIDGTKEPVHPTKIQSSNKPVVLPTTTTKNVPAKMPSKATHKAATPVESTVPKIPTTPTTAKEVNVKRDSASAKTAKVDMLIICISFQIIFKFQRCHHHHHG